MGLYPHWHVTLGLFYCPKIMDMLTRYVEWHVLRHLCIQSKIPWKFKKNACEIKNDEAKHVTYNHRALFCFIFFSNFHSLLTQVDVTILSPWSFCVWFPVQSRQEKWSRVTLKNKWSCSLEQQKCCLVICDHVFGREEKYFCVANGCSPIPQKLP